MKTQNHACINIDGFWERQDCGGIISEGDRSLGDQSTRALLRNLKHQGFDYFVGDACDRVDKTGRCSGHQFVEVSGLDIEFTPPTGITQKWRSGFDCPVVPSPFSQTEQLFVDSLLGRKAYFKLPFWIDSGFLVVPAGNMVVMFYRPNKPDPSNLLLISNGSNGWIGGDCYITPQDVKEWLNDVGIDSFDPIDFALPSVDAPPSNASVRWIAPKSCPDCDGNGWVGCDLGHAHECPKCEGSGKGRVRRAGHWIGDFFGIGSIRTYEAWLLAQLPGIRFGHPKDKKLPFKFLGGCGVVVLR